MARGGLGTFNLGEMTSHMAGTTGPALLQPVHWLSPARLRQPNAQAWAMTKKDGPAAIALAQRAQALLADCPEAQPSDEVECWRSQNYWRDMLSMAEQIGDPETHAAEEVLLALAG
jgi:hypothetical protein